MRSEKMTNKTPCEIIVWYILPAIRCEIAKRLIENYGLTQRKVAEKLGITEATVSRYVSGKRGSSEVFNNSILDMINESANRIFEGDSKTTIIETCGICNLMKANNMIKDISY
ncbi:MAG: transcriptional regulator [Candidatus Hodarchaeales archaeon]